MTYKLITLFFICFVFSQVVFSQNASNDPNQDYLQNYTHFQSKGEYKNGQKDGKWIDLSDRGSIYVEGYYNNGTPVSKWKINFPNGKIRKEIAYDSIGNIIRWSRFDKNGSKIIEIKPDSTLDVITMLRIAESEEAYYQNETMFCGQDLDPKMREEQKPYEISSGPDVFGRYANYHNLYIQNSLKDSDFTGKSLLFYATGNIVNQTNFEKGKVITISKFYYKNNKIDCEDVYIDYKLKRTIKYDKTGQVINIKEK